MKGKKIKKKYKNVSFYDSIIKYLNYSLIVSYDFLSLWITFRFISSPHLLPHFYSFFQYIGLQEILNDGNYLLFTNLHFVDFYNFCRLSTFLAI